MYLLTKYDGHSSYGNGDISSYISSYMMTSEKDEVIASVRQIERFSKSGILIHNSEEKQEEQHRQLISVMCFTQTQLRFHYCR